MDHSLKDLLHGRVLHVPDYQRGFAWEPEHLQEFWEDLQVLRPGRNHYTGTVVLLRHQRESEIEDDRGRVYRPADIVDGQQRLTTITLLLAEVEKRLRGNGETLQADDIRDTYLSYLKGSERKPITTLGRDINRYWQHSILELDGGTPIHLQPRLHSEHRLLAAKQFFSERLDEMLEPDGAGLSAIQDLRSKLTNRLRFTLYEVEDDAQVGVIFETLNDRGKPLTELEKVKNYLMFLASGLEPSERENLIERINHAWSDIYQLLMAAEITEPREEDRFLRAHWLMMHDPIRRNWDGTGSIKQRYSRHQYWQEDGADVATLAELTNYVGSLADSAKAFCDLRKPRRAEAFQEFDASVRPAVRHESIRLERLGTLASFTPLLMAVRLRFQGDGELYRRVAELCEGFSFRVYSALESRADTGQSRLFTLAHDVYDDQHQGEQILSELRRAAAHWCPRKRFERALSAEGDERDWYHWSGLKYFLYEYEEHLTGPTRAVKKDWEEVAQARREETVEHILPQTPRPGDWTSFDAEARARWTHDLGNLVLTFDNSHYSNKAFRDKRSCSGDGYSGSGAPRCYEWSPLLQERQLAEYEQWTPAEVRRRHSELRDWAIERWHVEGDDEVDPDFAGDDGEDEGADSSRLAQN